MVATIEKELLHYEILNAMDEAGFLDFLVFQGGTSMRLCYGAERYSEDLDFCGGRSFDESKLDRLKSCIEHALASRYHVDALVRTPRDRGNLVNTWTVVVDTFPTQSNIARQRIKIEVATIDVHDPIARPLNVNYEGLPNSYVDLILRVESQDEILADKIEAFVCSNHLRYRDLWDMSWLSRSPGIDLDHVCDLRELKAIDYAEVDMYAERLSTISEKLDTAFASSAITPSALTTSPLSKEMSRFLPSARIARTIQRPIWLQATRKQLDLLFAVAAPKVVARTGGSGGSQPE
ncbi:nucleotidyl transferase AbiEii/AbiGii toxin family protein [Bifidobacterium sp.]